MRDYLSIILIFSVILILFYTGFSNRFKADDYAIAYVSKVSQIEPSYILTLDLGNFFRPVNRLLSLGLYSILGLNHVGYNIIAVLLHFVNTVLVYYIAKRFANSRIALISSLLFATLAVHFDSILFQSAGIADSTIFTLFFLTSFISFIAWNDTKKKRYLVLSLIAFVLNLLTYEDSVVLPPLLLIYLWMFSKTDVRGVIRHAKILLLYMIPLIPYLVFQYLIQKSGHVVSIGIYRFGLHAFENLLSYFVSMSIVFPLIDISYLSRMNLPQFVHVTIPYVIILTSLTVLLAFIYILFKGSRESRFFILWYMISILPFLFFTTPIQSRYTYAPSVGFCILVGMLLYNVYKILSVNIGNTKAISVLYVSAGILMLANATGMMLIENYKFNNGVSDESVMIDFMKSRHASFPDRSKVYFVNDSMPFRDLPLIMVMSLYYPDGIVEPRNLTVSYNQITITYTVYYPVNYTVYEITRDEVPRVVKDNSTYIFDFIKTDYRPGKGVELT